MTGLFGASLCLLLGISRAHASEPARHHSPCAPSLAHVHTSPPEPEKCDCTSMQRRLPMPEPALNLPWAWQTPNPKRKHNRKWCCWFLNRPSLRPCPDGMRRPRAADCRGDKIPDGTHMHLYICLGGKYEKRKREERSGVHKDIIECGIAANRNACWSTEVPQPNPSPVPRRTVTCYLPRNDPQCHGSKIEKEANSREG